ncbi:PP2C family protein-serine/threonine phosphatase [candidate division KSB1 bacterium]
MSIQRKTNILQDLIPAILCVSGLILTLFLFEKDEFFSNFSQPIDKNNTLQQGRNLLQALNYEPDNYTLSVNRTVNTELLTFVQKNKIYDSGTDEIPIITWQVQCISIKTEDSGENPRFIFNTKNELIYFDRALTDSLGSNTLTETEAEITAKTFIQNFTQIDTTSLSLISNSYNQSGGSNGISISYRNTSYSFTDLDERLDIIISDNEVVSFLRTVNSVLPEEESILSRANIVVFFFSIFLLTMITFIILITFFKKLKRDELEYRHSMWIGLFVGLAWAGGDIINSPANISSFSGSVFFGGIIFLFYMLAYSVGESLTREIWREKLISIDTLLNGRYSFSEIGNQIIRGTGLACVGYFIFIGMEWMVREKFGSWILIPFSEYPAVDPIWIFASVIFNKIPVIATAFIFYVLVWGTILKKYFTRRRSLVLFSIFTIVPAGAFLFQINPDFSATLIFFPIAVVWVWYWQKEDFLTILVALSLGILLFSLQEILLASNPYSQIFVYMIFGFVMLVYLGGLYLRKTGKDISQLDSYVPDYEHRLAEKARIKRELEIARDVQESFLPSTTPNVSGAEIEALCQPAQEVGGDYFDFFPYDENRVGMLIGDVSGKGVSAAFFMTMVKGIVKTLTREYESPKEILSNLNNIFYENAPRGVFISVIYALFDFKKKELIFARAGHLPILIRQKNRDEIQQLVPKGMAIGLDRGEKFDKALEERTVTFDPGDLFLFYTDGVSEASNNKGEEFGDERLNRIISKYADNRPDRLIEMIRDSVLRFSGKAGRQDDIAVIAVKIDENVSK